MKNTESSNHVSPIATLRNEIAQLRELQDDALKIASYVGMTPEEGAEYDARHNRILALTKELRTLQASPARN